MRAIDADRLKEELSTLPMMSNWGESFVPDLIDRQPTVQPQRDIPKKPHEVTDRSWGISMRQAVCPNCDCYLGMVHFICEGDKKKVTYCESCGQAIDWTEWEEEHES